MTCYKKKHQPLSPKHWEMHPQWPPIISNVAVSMANAVGQVDVVDEVDTVDTVEVVEPETAPKVCAPMAQL
jgi:hypothetical protein